MIQLSTNCRLQGEDSPGDLSPGNSTSPRRQPAGKRNIKADGQISVCPFTIIIDTREQAPWYFTALSKDDLPLIVKTERGTLQTGDYSIKGFEHLIAIERKSKGDLAGSVSVRNARFRREHERMLKMVEEGGDCTVIVECSLGDALHQPDKPWLAKTINGVQLSWPKRYRVQWMFCDTRRLAEIECFKVLDRFWREWEKKLKREAKEEAKEELKEEAKEGLI